MQVFEGFEECNQIDIFQATNLVSSYIKLGENTTVKIEIELQEGLKPGDPVHITQQLKQKQVCNDLFPDYGQMRPCPGVFELETAEIIEGAPSISTSYNTGEYPVSIVYTEQGDYDGGYFTDRNGTIIEYFGHYVNQDAMCQTRIKEVYEVDVYDTNGYPICYQSVYEATEIPINTGSNFTWWVSDSLGNPLGGTKTVITIFEKTSDENATYQQTKRIVLDGDYTPNTVACSAPCDADCIELWDENETYRICLCEHTGDVNKDLVFPNLDAESWPMFE